MAVVGEDWVVAAVLQALVQSRASEQHFRTALLPTGQGVVAARVAMLDENLHNHFPLDTDWSQMSSGEQRPPHCDGHG